MTTTIQQPLTWRRGFRYPHMIHLLTPFTDGSLIHAALNATSLPYQMGTVDQVPIDRMQLVAATRNNLIRMLEEPVGSILARPIKEEDQQLGAPVTHPRFYEMIGARRLPELARTDQRYTLEAIQASIATMGSRLATDRIFRSALLDLLGYDLERNIYVLDAEARDLTDRAVLDRSWRSIVLLTIRSHVETVGITQPNDGGIVTDFAPDDPFLAALDQAFRVRESTIGNA